MKLGIIHAVFWCECGEGWSDYLTAHHLAKRHHKQTGHQVMGEEGVSYKYPKKEKK